MADDAGDRNPDGDPFANIPMFSEIARALAGQGPLNWDAARQFAALSSGGDGAQGNVDPADRIAIERLVPIAAMHVRHLCDVDLEFPDVTAVTSAEWAQRTLDAYRPLFTELATSLTADADGAEDADPLGAMMAGLGKLMGPSIMGMAIGSMVGRMAEHAFGQYDLPIPRGDGSLLVIPASINRFAADWNVPVDEVRLWVVAQELIGHTVLSMGTVRDDLAALVRAHVGAFSPDPSAAMEQLSGIEMDLTDPTGADPMAMFQELFSDPSVLLGAVQSQRQREMEPRLDAAVGAVIGCVDYLVDSVAVALIGGDALQIAEAVRRRRAERSADDVYVHRLLGLRLDQAQVQRGKQFIAAVVDRVGEARLCELLSTPGALPTPAEFEAPGLWIARLELDEPPADA